MSSILQYEDNTTQGKGQYKKIIAGDKLKVNASVTLLKLLKANDRVPLFNMSIKKIKEVKNRQEN